MVVEKVRIYLTSSPITLKDYFVFLQLHKHMFEYQAFRSPENLAIKMVEYISKSNWGEFNERSQFTVTHSINHEDFSHETAIFSDLDMILTDFLRDLDSQEGIFYYGEQGIEVDESALSQDEIYRDWGKKQDRAFWAAEGLLLIKNVIVGAEGEYPMIVTKPSIYNEMGNLIPELLRWNSYNNDYTGRLAPAVYLGIEHI